MHRQLGLLALCVMAALGCSRALAFDYQYVGGTGDWRDPTKWNPNVGYPGSGPADTATLPQNTFSPVTLNGAVALTGLSVGGDSSVTVTGNPAFGVGSLTSSGALGNRGDVSLTSTGGVFSSSYGFTSGTGTFFNDGSLHVQPGTGGGRFLRGSINNDGLIFIGVDTTVGASAPTESIVNGIGGLGSVQVVKGATLFVSQYQNSATTLLSGAINGQTGPVSVTGGKFIGDGVVNDALSVGPGIVQPLGNVDGQGYTGLGTLTVNGATTFGANSQLAILLGTATGSELVANGDLTLNTASSALTLTGGSPGVTYVVATYTGNRTGTFAGSSPGYQVSYSTPGEILVTVAPEPAGLGVLGAVLVMGVRRRRGR